MGVAAEDDGFDGDGAHVVDGAHDVLLGSVAVAVDIENVLLAGARVGARLDHGEVDVVFDKAAEDVIKLAPAVADLEHEGGLVVAGGDGFVLTDDDEAGLVVTEVFDMFREAGEAVEFEASLVGESGGLGVVQGFLDGGGGGDDFDDIGFRKVVAEPKTALGCGLRAGVDTLDVFEVGGDGAEVVVNVEEGFADDFDVCDWEGVEGFGDDTGNGVFDGNDAVVGLAALDGEEDFADVEDGYEPGASAERFDGSLVGEGAFGAPVGDLERLFGGDGGGDDLFVNGREFFGTKKGGGGASELFVDLLFAFGDEEGLVRQSLEAADFSGQVHAAIEEADDVLVDLVDLRAHRIEGRFVLGVFHRSSF